MGQPNIQVPLVKRTTSFSYFYGSEWKMVIYEDHMPKTSCYFITYCHHVKRISFDLMAAPKMSVNLLLKLKIDSLEVFGSFFDRL